MKNIFSVFWLKKLKLVQLTYAASIYLQQFLIIIGNPKSCSLRSLPDMKLLNKLLIKAFLIPLTVTFVLRKTMSGCLSFAIADGSWQHCFVLLDMLVFCSYINYILRRKNFHPKYFKFYCPSSLPPRLSGQILLKKLNVFCRCFLKGSCP